MCADAVKHNRFGGNAINQQYIGVQMAFAQTRIIRRLFLQRMVFEVLRQLLVAFQQVQHKVQRLKFCGAEQPFVQVFFKTRAEPDFLHLLTLRRI